MIAEVNIEAYVGVVISAFIGKAGIEMILDTLSDLLGRRVDRTLIDRIKSTVSREPEVHGVYDLLLHNYDPDNHGRARGMRRRGSLYCFSGG